MTKGAAGYFCGDPPLARMSGYCGDFKKLRNDWAMHPEDFVPGSIFGWRRRFRRWRLKRAGRLSHLVWEFVCVKPFPWEEPDMQSWADIWRRWRRQIKSSAPFVRRRVYRVMQRKYARLLESLDGLATPATHAQLQVRKPLAQDMVGEVCLFVTHAAQPVLKTHAIHHIVHLLDAGIQVVLVFNTDLAADTLLIDAALEARLSGVLVRENIGFDFGAWAHAYSLFDRTLLQRLYLVNDSIVGPLDHTDFTRMIGRIRASNANFIGLTESLAQTRHLQSYFLVFNRRALLSPALDKLMRGILNLPDKGQVVDVYQARLTQKLCALGLHSEALFPALSSDLNSSDDTSTRWERLLSAGFPYLKTRIIQQFPRNPQVRAARVHGRVDKQI